MKGYKRLVAVLCILLCGCATWGQFEDGLRTLKGRNIDDAINVLGMPSGERTVAGKRYIQWGRSSSEFMPITSPSTTYGTVSTNKSFGTYSATTYTTSYIPVDYSCSVTMQIDSNDTIVRIEYEGNLGGCEPYINNLNQFRKQVGAR